MWDTELQGDEDRGYLIDGLKNCFKISDLSGSDYVNIQKVELDNHQSAKKYSTQVENELKSQIELGYYVGSDGVPTIVSPIGAIPKDNGKDVKIIHDGSRPTGEAMNDYSSLHAVKYETLESAYSLAKPGYYLAKIDLKAAYRSVGIHPSDYCLTGIKWHFKDNDYPTYLFDTRLPFGARRGCSIFHRISQAVKRMMAKRGFSNLVVYLDDFLIVSATWEECAFVQQVLINLLGSLGFFISWHKVAGPFQRLCFLGIDIDTVECKLLLDELKVHKLSDKLCEFRDKVRASKRQLQSLAGLLNWACQAVTGGRFFLRRVLDVIKCLKESGHKAKLDLQFKKDILWWLTYIKVFMVWYIIVWWTIIL